MNQKIPVKIKKLKPEAIMPAYATPFAAGADLYACTEDAAVVIEPHQTAFIPTGLSIEIPDGYAGLVYARSGIACKRGLAPANKVGVIDSDYRGEIMVVLHNHSDQPQQIANRERVPQLVITPKLPAYFTEAETLEETDRGEGGFGSTGK